MTPALRYVRENHSPLLQPGESFLAAATARVVAGIPDTPDLPPVMLWAVSNQRLMIWESRGRGSPSAPMTVLELGAAVTGAFVQPFDGTWVALSVFVGNQSAVVTMTPEDANAFETVISEAVNVAVPMAPTPAKPEATAELPAVDPTRGDPDLEAISACLTAGDWEAVESRFKNLDPAYREVTVFNLVGAENLDLLNAWLHAKPQSADAYLMRGVARASWAFSEDQGYTRNAANSRDDRLFHARLRAAEVDLWRSVELQFKDPVPWSVLLASARGLQIGVEEFTVRFDESVRRHPGLFIAHAQTLIGLSRTWLGSGQEVFGFAESFARPAPEGSPLHALVPLAHLMDSVVGDGTAQRGRTISTNAEREISLFADVSVDNPSWVDDATTVEAVNIFALAWHLCGDHDHATRLWKRIGGRRTLEPWRQLPDPADVFHKLSGPPTGHPS